jgi:large subunit ribosomal protein L7/L12
MRLCERSLGVKSLSNASSTVDTPVRCNDKTSHVESIHSWAVHPCWSIKTDSVATVYRPGLAVLARIGILNPNDTMSCPRHPYSANNTVIVPSLRKRTVILVVLPEPEPIAVALTVDTTENQFLGSNSSHTTRTVDPASAAAVNAPETPTPPATTTTTTTETPKPAPVVFQYAKSQDLFERITETMLVKEDIHALQEKMSKILGRTWRKNEFYYTGFGGRKVKGGKGGGGDEAVAEAAPVKTLFDLKLVGFDATSKIKVIKEVRAIAGLGLKEAKEMVEGFPKVILKDLKKEQADEFKVKLEELGAIIELV